MNKLRIGVFGAGRGKTMINVLLHHPEAELTAVCDQYAPLLNEAVRIAGEKGAEITAFADFDAFIRSGLDAVVLANYATEHAPYAIRALDMGIHVLSEVLPSETIAQAVALAEAVERSGCVYAYAENYCYMNRTFEMWRRYRRGDIGEVTYAEGEYVHDCLSIAPRITQGNRSHWRNLMSPFYYCTHSFGPLMTITDKRPVRVTGLLTRKDFSSAQHGINPAIAGMAGLEMVELENGAMVKSLHGGLKREPGSTNYIVYGSRGCMETQRFGEENLNVYIEGDKACVGALETYLPKTQISPELAERFGSHGGSDFYATHFFIERILDRPEGKEFTIDVYQAADMGLVGIMAHRSHLAGGVPMEIPNLRDPAVRDRFRNDHASTNPATGDPLLPQFMGAEDMPAAPNSAYEKLEKLFLEGKTFEN